MFGDCSSCSEVFVNNVRVLDTGGFTVVSPLPGFWHCGFNEECEYKACQVFKFPFKILGMINTA